MNQRFTLAAQVLLTRRLKDLFRVDDMIEIDTGHITCAEYQLFIDAQQAEKKRVQPNHWTIDRFFPGTARHPIRGVSANDAMAFCDWLTEQKLTPGFRYRLPKSSEVYHYSTARKKLGCWCRDGNIYTIAGIKLNQWKRWQEQLQKKIKLNALLYVDAGSFFPEPTYAHAYTRVLHLADNPDFNFAINLATTLSLANVLGFDRASVLDLELAHDHNHASVLDHIINAFDLDINDLDNALSSIRLLALESGLDLNLRHAVLLLMITTESKTLVYFKTTCLVSIAA